MSKIYAIGVGVGDTLGLTLKAMQTLKKIDVLYCPTSKKDNDSIAYTIAKEYISDKTKIKNRHFPMTRDKNIVDKELEIIADEMSNDVKSGKNVAFITIGDVMIYSTFIYLIKKIKKEIEIQIISGVPSFVDVASKGNFPIAFDDNPFVVIPATTDMDTLEKYIRDFDCIVIMKAYKNYDKIIELIKKYNLVNNTFIVSNSSRENEKIIQGKDIFSEENNEYLTTILINKNWEN